MKSLDTRGTPEIKVILERMKRKRLEAEEKRKSELNNTQVKDTIKTNIKTSKSENVKSVLSLKSIFKGTKIESEVKLPNSVLPSIDYKCNINPKIHPKCTLRSTKSPELSAKSVICVKKPVNSNLTLLSPKIPAILKMVKICAYLRLLLKM